MKEGKKDGGKSRNEKARHMSSFLFLFQEIYVIGDKDREERLLLH